jgi:hypothetical protein
MFGTPERSTATSEITTKPTNARKARTGIAKSLCTFPNAD